MFHKELIKIQNTGQSRSIIVCGNVYDLFWNEKEFVPLIPFLCEKTQADGLIQLVYELNGPIRIKPENRNKIKEAWVKWQLGEDPNARIFEQLRSVVREGKDNGVKKCEESFEKHLTDCIGNPTTALEFLRQLTICSRTVMKENLLIIVEGADMLLPAGNGDVASLSETQLHRNIIVSDWLGDPAFNNGHDTVVFIAESRSLIHPRIAKLPQVMSVEVASPDIEARKKFLETIAPQTELSDNVAELTAGLSIVALQQLVKSNNVTGEAIVAKVEEFIQGQLGEDVVEFKKPSHSLNDCIGFTRLKKFLNDVMIPRMKLRDKGMLPGAAVAGPLGAGKTFIFEAVAGELGMPVIVLKNIRSQWFGQTDVVFERLRRVLEALDRVLIFVDEADTQFGGVGADTHETERRLTGKIQAMMSDPKLKGKVYWLLMTARIHLLSPDIRRPGRVGDLIIPVLDPEEEDRKQFMTWALDSVLPIHSPGLKGMTVEKLLEHIPKDYSAASFTSLKNNLAYKKQFATLEELVAEIKDFIQPAIGQTRRYQTLQALVNCTRRSLLPNPEVNEKDREKWELEILELEAKGIK